VAPLPCSNASRLHWHPNFCHSCMLTGCIKWKERSGSPFMEPKANQVFFPRCLPVFDFGDSARASRNVRAPVRTRRAAAYLRGSNAAATQTQPSSSPRNALFPSWAVRETFPPNFLTPLQAARPEDNLRFVRGSSRAKVLSSPLETVRLGLSAPETPPLQFASVLRQVHQQPDVQPRPSFPSSPHSAPPSFVDSPCCKDASQIVRRPPSRPPRFPPHGFCA